MKCRSQTRHAASHPEGTGALIRQLLEHERIAVAFCIVVVVALAWSWLVRHAGMTMEPHYGYLAVMWAVMMVAMMLPTAAPMILLFAMVSEREKAQGRAFVPTSIFAGTYLAVWGAVALAAAGLQAWIESSVEPVMAEGLSGRSASAALLIAAGVYQFTPLKHACLRRCRSPLQFIMTRWRPGWPGALRMGLEHGAYCVGCCWLLMGLLFVGGVMNLWWVVGIAVYVLLEKVLPAAPWVSGALGVALIVGGALVLLGPIAS